MNGGLPNLNFLLNKIKNFSNPTEFLMKIVKLLPGLPNKDQIINNLQILNQYIPNSNQTLNIQELKNIANNTKVQEAMFNTLNGFIGSEITFKDIQELNNSNKVKESVIALILFYILGLIDYFIQKTEGIFGKLFGGEPITITLGALGAITMGSGAWTLLVIIAFAITIALIILVGFTVFSVTTAITLLGIVGLLMLPEILFMIQAGHVNTPAMQIAAKGIYDKDSTYIKDRNNTILKISNVGLSILSKGFTATMDTLTILITATTGLIPFIGGGIRNTISDLDKYLVKGDINFQDVLNNMYIMPKKPSIFDKTMFGFAVWITYIAFYLECLKRGKKILPKISSINQCMGIY